MTILCDPAVGSPKQENCVWYKPKDPGAREKSPGNSGMYPAFPCNKLKMNEKDGDE